MKIQITTPKSQLDSNLERIETPILRIEKRMKACVSDLNESFDAFWKLPDDQINEILAYKGVEDITRIFTAHNENGVAFNKLLEERGVFGVQAVVAVPRELVMNGEGNLEVVPLPEPEIVDVPE